MSNSFPEIDVEAGRLVKKAEAGFQKHDEDAAMDAIQKELNDMNDDYMKSMAHVLTERYADKAKVNFQNGWPVSIDFFGKGETMHIPTGMQSEELEAPVLYFMPKVKGIELGKIEFEKPSQERDPAIEDALQNSQATKWLDRGEEVKYMYNKVDLSGTGKNEALVYLLGDKFCGTGGCSTLVLKKNGEKYDVISDMSVTQTPIIVGPDKSAGMRDLIEETFDSSKKLHYTRMRFDGRSYPTNPTVEPYLQEGSKISGTAYLAYDRTQSRPWLAFRKN